MSIAEALKKYAERFEGGFPMAPLGWGRTDEEVVEMIEKCLARGEDVYGLGILKQDDEVMF